MMLWTRVSALRIPGRENAVSASGLADRLPRNFRKIAAAATAACC